MEILTDLKKIEELDAISYQKQFNIKGEKENFVKDKKKIEELDAISKKDQKLKEEEPNEAVKYIKDFYSEYISGDVKTEFPNMGEIYTINSKGNVKGALKDLALNFGYMTTADQNARLDMLFEAYPGSAVSKDSFNNVMITLPENLVDKNTNRTFYLDKPGLSFNGAIDTIGTMLTYIPGAGWVAKKGAMGLGKKVVLQGTAAATTGVAGDIYSSQLGNTQGDGLLPIVDEGKALLNFGFGAAGEKIGQVVTKIVGLNTATNFLENKIPSNIASTFFGKQNYITNKGEITQKTINLAKKLGVEDNVLKNKISMTNFALGLENGLEANVAAKVGGLNEFGISVFLAAAQGNKKALKEIDLIRKGGAGENMQNIVLAQDDLILQQHFKALNEIKNKMITEKNSALSSAFPPNTKNLAANAVDDNIAALDKQINDVAIKMQKSVNRKYDAIDWNQDFKKPVVKNLVKNFKDALTNSDSGIGQGFNKTTMPNTAAFLKNMELFSKKLNNKKLTKITMGALESERKSLNKIMSNTRDATDLAALSVMKKRFDFFYDAAVEKGLANGNAEVLNVIKSARAASADYKKLFVPQKYKSIGVNIPDKGGQFTQKVLNGDYTNSQIANFVYGSSKVGGSYKEVGVPVVKKLYEIFPEGSNGRDLIKVGAFNRLIENSFKQYGSREIFSPKLFAKAVNDAIDGTGKNVSNIIYTETQKKGLINFAKEIEKQLSEKSFVNTTKGANAFMEILDAKARGLAGIVGFNVANIQGLLLTRSVYDSAKAIAKRNADLADIQNAITIAKLPSSSGGAGGIDIAMEKRPIAQDLNKNQVYSTRGNNIQIMDAKTLEQYKIIESLNKYR
jgi:hypothetical protein